MSVKGIYKYTSKISKTSKTSKTYINMGTKEVAGEMTIY